MSFARTRRSQAAYTRDQPDPLTAAFIELLARKATLLPPYVRRLLNLSPAQA